MSLTTWAIEGKCGAGAGQSRFWGGRMGCDVFLFIVFLLSNATYKTVVLSESQVVAVKKSSGGPQYIFDSWVFIGYLNAARVTVNSDRYGGLFRIAVRRYPSVSHYDVL